jgi:hypothetical protein
MLVFRGGHAGFLDVAWGAFEAGMDDLAAIDEVD